MKPLFLFLAVAIATGTSASAQMGEVISDTADTKGEIYAKSAEWIVKNWHSPRTVIEVNDPADGLLVAKCDLLARPVMTGIPSYWPTYTTITIRVKDGKAKIDFADTFANQGYYGWAIEPRSRLDKKSWQRWCNDVEHEVDGLIRNYKAAILTPNDKNF